MNTTNCTIHGLNGVVFICKHLFRSKKKGVFWSKDEEDSSVSAWCLKCESVRAKNGEWSDEILARMDIKILCEKCFDQVKTLNRLNNMEYLLYKITNGKLPRS